jgi:hypothetical protein
MDFYPSGLPPTFEVGNGRCIGKGRQHPGIGRPFLSKLSLLFLKVEIFNNKRLLGPFTKSNNLG